MKPMQILGVAGIAIGMVLVGFGYHASNAPVDRVSEALTGRFTDATMWYLVLGVAAAVGGGLMFLFGRRS